MFYPDVGFFGSILAQLGRCPKHSGLSARNLSAGRADGIMTAAEAVPPPGSAYLLPGGCYAPGNPWMSTRSGTDVYTQFNALVLTAEPL